MIRLSNYRRSALMTTAIIVFITAGVEAGGFVYKPAKRDSDKIHLTTDFAGHWRLTGDFRHPNVQAAVDHPEIRLMLSLDVGLYKNLSKKHGFGGGLFASSSGESNRIGIRGRYRRWLSEYGRLDFSPGIVLTGDYEGADFVIPGFAGSLSYSPIRWCSIVAAVDVVRLEKKVADNLVPAGEKWTVTSVYGGVRLESYAGAVGIGTVAVGVVLLAIAVASALDN